MDLNKLNARLAPRSCWQAMDMGTRLYRQATPRPRISSTAAP